MDTATGAGCGLELSRGTRVQLLVAGRGRHHLILLWPTSLIGAILVSPPRIRNARAVVVTIGFLVAMWPFRPL